MRIGLLADIHGNSVALQAVLKDASEHPSYHRAQTYSPDASYAVVERSGDGWHVEQRKVPYDHARAAEQARKVGRPDWAQWLATGRATPASPARR
ncbi:MAG TPA: hypothetical protein VOA87_10830 [Thermoanaerobaculia bacterium]|nr:hypothetical protein [Thermoanaerobaculia bacterium]